MPRSDTTFKPGNRASLGHGRPPKTLTARDLALITKLAARGVRVRRQHTNARAGDVRDSLADIDKARRLLGYSVTVGFADGLRETLEAAAETLDRV